MHMKPVSLIRRSTAAIAVAVVILVGSAAPAFAYPPNPYLRNSTSASAQ